MHIGCGKHGGYPEDVTDRFWDEWQASVPAREKKERKRKKKSINAMMVGRVNMTCENFPWLLVKSRMFALFVCTVQWRP